jgi:hypothetical protein
MKKLALVIGIIGLLAMGATARADVFYHNSTGATRVVWVTYDYRVEGDQYEDWAYVGPANYPEYSWEEAYYVEPGQDLELLDNVSCTVIPDQNGDGVDGEEWVRYSYIRDDAL